MEIYSYALLVYENLANNVHIFNKRVKVRHTVQLIDEQVDRYVFDIDNIVNFSSMFILLNLYLSKIFYELKFTGWECRKEIIYFR